MAIIIHDINEARAYVAQNFRYMVEHTARLQGYEMVPAVHDYMADWLQSGNPINPEWVAWMKVILGFRLLAKSWMLRVYNKWRWLRCPYTQIVIQSSNEQNAGRMARAQLRMLQQDPLMAHLAPEGQTGVYEWNLRGVEPEAGWSLCCAGIKSAITSGRADLFEFDDPEPDNDPESMHDRIIRAIEEAKNILHRADRHLPFLTSINPEVTTLPHAERTQMIVVGQPHGQNTVYLPDVSLFDEQDEPHPLRAGKFLIVPMLGSDGSFTWPYMVNQKFRDAKEDRPLTPDEVRALFTTETWECQYMINPQFAIGRGAVLHLNDVEECHRIVPSAIMAIDPADGEGEGSSEWGVSIMGLFSGENGRQIHVCYMGGFTGDSYEGDEYDDTIGESVWRSIFDIADEFNVVEVLLEINLVAARRACARYMRKAGRIMRITEIRAKGNKLTRITSTLEQPFNNGMVTLAPDVLADGRNRRQLTTLKHNSLPKPADRIDSLAMGFIHLLEMPDVEDAGLKYRPTYQLSGLHGFSRAGGGRSLVESH